MAGRFRSKPKVSKCINDHMRKRNSPLYDFLLPDRVASIMDALTVGHNPQTGSVRLLEVAKKVLRGISPSLYSQVVSRPLERCRWPQFHPLILSSERWCSRFGLIVMHPAMCEQKSLISYPRRCGTKELNPVSQPSKSTSPIFIESSNRGSRRGSLSRLAIPVSHVVADTTFSARNQGRN